VFLDDDGVDDLNDDVEGVEVGAKEEEEVLEPKVEEKPVAKKIVLNRRIEFPSDNDTPKEQPKTTESSDSAETKKITEISMTAAEVNLYHHHLQIGYNAIF
jgi:hypothetical protein